MRYESSVTSVSWIPSEAMTGPLRVPVDIGIGHYDAPLPAHIDDLEALRLPTDFGLRTSCGRGSKWTTAVWSMPATRRAATWDRRRSRSVSGSITIPAVSFPDLRAEPVVTATTATFRQTTGGRTGRPSLGRIRRPPFLKIVSPTVWTTLTLTLRTDGSHTHAVAGASKMPRHWIYDDSNDLVAKSGMIDFKGWTQESFGDNTPWGDVDSPAIVTAVETQLERQLSVQIMREPARSRRSGSSLPARPSPSREIPGASCTSSSTECCPWRLADIALPKLAPDRFWANAPSSRGELEPRRFGLRHR